MRASRAAEDALPEETGEPTAPSTTTSLQGASRHTAPQTPVHTDRPRAHAWAELLRLPALFTVPGDALAGAAAASVRPTSRTLLAIASSLCLYEAGMALNDWADRDVDAVERPHRPLPSGRVHPTSALGAACALTGAGLTLAACAGRPALTIAVPLAATVWAYDLALKDTPAGPFAMATARGLDLLLGAAATAGGGGVGAGVGQRNAVPGGTWTRGPLPPGSVLGNVETVPAAALPGVRQVLPAAALPGVRQALPSAVLLGAHTLAITAVSRREAQGGSALAPFAALAATAVLTRTVTRRRPLPSDRTDASRRGPGSRDSAGPPRVADLAAAAVSRLPRRPRRPGADSEPLDTHAALRLALAAAYAATTARSYLHATLNPSPPLTQRAVTAGIRATIPLQAALAARSRTKSATVTALLTTALAPLAGRFARKVSVT
ncbi:SCO3242 family prenyltransferase [Streptomyces sp. CC0208]|uniref:SCO3242 family prenyltransferase n=1 Tax=Streptomyces sp. CC0208 TaxID=2306165 RepID=UPI000E4C5644|nr:UbiA family prenyltransferase [Streptomyces sp. CC0208]